MVEVRGQLDDHRRGPALEPSGGLGHSQGIDVQTGEAERCGVSRVGRFHAGILLVGADLDQRLPQRRVALGVVQAGSGVRPEPGEPVAGLGGDAGGVVLDLLHRRQGRAPADRVLGLVAGLVEQGRGPAQPPLQGRGASLPLVQDVGEGQAAQGRHRQQRGRQGHRPPPARTARPRRGPAPPRRGPSRQCGPARPPRPCAALPRAGRFGGAGHLGGAEPLLHARQVRGQPAATPPASRGRSSRSAARQARARSSSSASAPQDVQPGEGVGQVATRRLALDLARTATREGGPAGEHFTQDRAQGEDVGPLVQPIDLAPRLLRRHVGRRPHHAAGVRPVRHPNRCGPWR